jgi:hypothetical protein
MKIAAFVYSVALMVERAAAAPVLTQIHVITRHGSRRPLEKEANLLEIQVEPQLTPLGQLQLYNVGNWLLNRYNTSSSFFNTYQAPHVRFDSSQTDRTIVSANCLAIGLFQHRDPESKLPYPVAIPVDTFKDDSFLKPHSTCPKGLKLDTLYQSDSWTGLESAHANLLMKLGSMSEFSAFTNAGKIIPLTQLWNVYDEVHVSDTECSAANGSSTCPPNSLELRSLVTDAEWHELQQLAFQTEYLRYGSSGTLLSGNLLQTIQQRMGTAVTNNTSNTTGGSIQNFYHYSTHYPVLMGIFSALQVDPVNKTIPAYGSAIVMELYVDSSTSDKTVQMFFRPGGDVDYNFTATTLDVCKTGGSCPLGELGGFLNGFSTAQWCTACGSDADICLRKQAGAICTNNNVGGFSRVGLFLIGLVVGVFVALLVSLIVRMFQRRRSSEDETAVKPTEPFQTTVNENLPKDESVGELTNVA